MIDTKHLCISLIYMFRLLAAYTITIKASAGYQAYNIHLRSETAGPTLAYFRMINDNYTECADVSWLIRYLCLACRDRVKVDGVSPLKHSELSGATDESLQHKRSMEKKKSYATSAGEANGVIGAPSSCCTQF